MYRVTTALFVCFALFCNVAEPLSAQTKTDLPRLISTGTCMGPIPYSVIVVDVPNGVDQAKVDAEIAASLDHVNQLMSTYIKDSDVSRFNDSESTEFVAVNEETASVVARAIEISKLTEGAFDITVGPAVNLWKFGPNKDEFEVPNADTIAKAKLLVGYKKLEVRLDPPAIRKTNPLLRIDLSAIAKGYAVDEVVRRLETLGCKNLMVEVGGEVRCSGQRHTGGPWRVGVEKPDEVRKVPALVAELTEKSMATSGDYRNYHRVGKKRYSHTIDPTTCQPVDHHMASACIIADDCMSADAMATAVMVLGLERGQKFLDTAGVEYHLVERDSAFGRNFTTASSENFPIGELKLKRESEQASSSRQPSNSIVPVFIASASIFGLVILAMAIGAIFNNKPVQGSCGGLANVTNEEGESSCSICSKPTADCVELPNV